MQFEPFQDRLSRDIRNELSATVVKILAKGDITAAEAVADKYLSSGIERVYQEYIVDRLARYREVAEKVKGGPDDIFWQALVLWDQELFFEVHEVLEHAWFNSAGSEKKILQAMIRAAGVYIKLKYGYADAARKIANRAIPVLSDHQSFLSRYFELEKLLHALRKCDPEPPKLLK